MTDTVDQLTPGDEPKEDLNDDVVTRMMKAMDERFSGFQGVLDKNISKVREEFASQLQEVKRSSLTPEELEDLQESEKERELARLRRENELLKLRKDYPDEVDFLSDWLGEESFDNQLKRLAEFRSRRTEGPTPTEEPVTDESESSPVDLNNPPRKGGDSLADIVRSAGSEMTREQAQKLLQATNERGIMARLRRGN